MGQYLMQLWRKKRDLLFIWPLV